MIERKRNNKALLVQRRWTQGVMVLFFLSVCSLLSCAELAALLDPNRENTGQVQLANGKQWAPPIGCTVPWGIVESAQSAANIKRIDDFPSDADWVDVSGNGEPDNPLVIVADSVVTKMVRIREGSSYVILDGLTIRPEPSRDFGWSGSDVMIEAGTHHIAVRNCILLSTSDANIPQSPPTSTPDDSSSPLTSDAAIIPPSTPDASAVPQPPRQRTLLTTKPTEGGYIEYVTVFNCTIGPLGDWTHNEGIVDHAGLLFWAGTKHIRVFDCFISDIQGDAIGFPDENMRAFQGGVEFPASDIQIGRCHLQRCRENLIDGKLVQDIIISECILEKTNPFSTSSWGDAIVLHAPELALQQIIDDRGGTLQWMSPDNAWLLFNDIRDVGRGAILHTATFTPADRTGTMYSVGNKWTNIHAVGRTSGWGLSAFNGNTVLSFDDVFSSVDTHTVRVVIQDQIPREAFQQKFGRDLGQIP